MFRLGNQSQSTVGKIREAGSVRNSTVTSTSKQWQEISSSNIPPFEDEDVSPQSTPRSFVYNLSPLPETSTSSTPIYGVPPSTPLDDPKTKPNGDSQPFSNTEIPTADNPPARHPSSLPTPTVRMGTSLSHTVPSTKKATSSVPDTTTNDKVYDTSSPSVPSGRRTSEITVEYVKPSEQSIREYEELLKKAEVYATAAKDPFAPSTPALPPPSSHNSSNFSGSQQKTTSESSVPPTPPHPSQMNRVNLADFYAEPNPTAVLASGTAPTDPVDAPSQVSFSPTPADRMGNTSRSRVGSVTTIGKKGMLGFMTDFLKSHKRPEISTPYDPVRLTHAIFDSSTGEFTGLPKEWQQLLQDCEISKSNKENPLNVMENVKFYQEGGGDVWDKMGHSSVQGIFPPPPIPGAAPAAYPWAPRSVNSSAEESRNSPNAIDAVRSQATVASNGTVAERPSPQPPTTPQQRSAAVASSAGATSRRREKKREDKVYDDDIVRRLQQICTDADPTRLYRNLVKIGQG